MRSTDSLKKFDVHAAAPAASTLPNLQEPRGRVRRTGHRKDAVNGMESGTEWVSDRLQRQGRSRRRETANQG